jgi:hypothetical protein
MNIRAPNRRVCRLVQFFLGCRMLFAALGPEAALAINIRVDYSYDNSPAGTFFNTQQKKDALEAAAARFSAIITTSLTSQSLPDNQLDPRIGFFHPTTGEYHEVSPAHGPESDVVRTAPGGNTADEYRKPWTIPQNQWILYAGGRPLPSGVAGEGGTGTGTNITTVFQAEDSHLSRGFRATSEQDSLPVWGGAITFDSDGSTAWHFDLNTPAPLAKVDFYSVALHEIGHALGLSASNWRDWNRWTPAAQFTGPVARAAYNADNGTSLSGLNVTGDEHWQDGAYDSYIFHNGNPNYVGTVGPGVKQDLMMEPTAHFTVPIRRFELTNVDVAALRDIGWSTIPQIDAPSPIPGDYNNDGEVDVADYVVFRKAGLTTGTYTIWRQNFGESNGAGGNAVPEPATVAMLLIASVSLISAKFCQRRR